MKFSNTLLKKSIVTSFVMTLALPIFTKDKLVIISPHRKSIQREFIPKFKEYYKKTFKTDIIVDWLDQGGTSDDVRFVDSKFKKLKTTSKIDIFWGGGLTTFLKLKKSSYLQKYVISEKLQKEVPQEVAGVQLYDDSFTWYGAALSSFGIFFNKKIISLDKLPVPTTWSDLGKKTYQNQVVLTDPRRSGSASTMNTIIVEGLGWKKGTAVLTKIAANVVRFTHSSSDPIKAVVAGDVAIAFAIDFYANAKIGDLGEKNLGFNLPKSLTVLDPDPVAVLKGAPNSLQAQRFVDYILSNSAQKLLVLPKGAKNGPKFSTLGRMSVNINTYLDIKNLSKNKFNPFKQSAFLKINHEKVSKIRNTFNDLYGALFIDNHKELRKAWNAIIKRGSKQKDIDYLTKMPITEKEIVSHAKKWDDPIYRNKKLNEWVKFARSKYENLIAKSVQ